MDDDNIYSKKASEELQERLNRALKASDLYPAKIAEIYGLNKSGVARWFTHKVPEKHLPKLAKLLKVDFEWLATGKKMGKVSEAPNEYTPSDDYIQISVLDVNLSAGGGATSPEFVEQKESHSYKRTFLQRLGLKPDDLKVVYVHGDSMHPTIDDGDKVLVDTSRNKIIDMKIYGIVVGGDLKIKRLRKLFDGSVEIISDNPEHSDERIPPEQLEYLYIIGQVVEISRVVI